jgi:hypothetical protein
VTNVFALLRLLSASDRDKVVEILALRHQIAVLERGLSCMQMMPLIATAPVTGPGSAARMADLSSAPPRCWPLLPREMRACPDVLSEMYGRRSAQVRCGRCRRI